MAHIIVFGNEKGGSGKSTTCMHVATALARMGFNVGGLDLDLRQRSFGRYLENRMASAKREGVRLASPQVISLPQVDSAALSPEENIWDVRLSAAVAQLEDEVRSALFDRAAADPAFTATSSGAAL